MCGIAAVIGGEVPDRARCDMARDLMAHRGPDGRGSWQSAQVWLACRRLAIIDVTSAGHQPFHDPDSRVTIVFNGAIHNYVELQERLSGLGHRFRSHCDTEVLLRAYLQWGPQCVEQFNGMWAFVIWDERHGRAFFSRDRFGIKPLFLTRRRGGIALASEPKVLLELYPELRAVDERSLYGLLAEKRVSADEHSFYAGIESVPAAHSGTYTPGEADARLTRFWAVPEEEPGGEQLRRVVDRFGEVLEDAVRIRLRSDVPVAVTLSGGLDSTAVVHAARKGLSEELPLHTYTSVYGSRAVSELPWAEQAIAPYSGVELRCVPALVETWLDVLGPIVWHLDGPTFSPAVFPLWRIMEGAHRDGVKVLLEGQGADELLGGYPQHLACELADELAGMTPRRPLAQVPKVLATILKGCRSFSARRIAVELAMEMSPSIKAWEKARSTVAGALRPDFARDASAVQAPTVEPAGTHLRRRLLQDFARDLLPGFLHYGDAISMSHSIETRVPFLDHRLVELCFGLGGAFKVRAGETKAILRAYLLRSGQAAIAGRRQKLGYPTPTNEWMAHAGGAALKEVLLDPGARTRRFVDPGRLESLITRHASGAFSAGDVLFALLCTELWLGECIDVPRVNRGGARMPVHRRA